MNACQAVQELLTAHLLEALGPSETALVRDHLGACAVCREARDETQSALEHVEAPRSRLRPRCGSASASGSPSESPRTRSGTTPPTW